MVDAGDAITVDLAPQLPNIELGPIATYADRAETLDRVSELVKSHGTTLVLGNTRRLVERVTHRISECLGDHDPTFKEDNQ